MLQTFTIFISNHNKKKLSFFMIRLSSLIVFQEGIHHVANIFILIVTNYRKNDYYIIYHPNICKTVYSAFWFHVA